MEFTYNGMIRYGFGFDNPNHAAALFVMLLPLLWAARYNLKQWRFIIPLTIFEILLYAGIILTYSRTGFLALATSFILFYSLKGLYVDNVRLFFLRKRFLLWTITGITIFFSVAFFAGTASRYFVWISSPDRSVLNRFIIWNGAAQILADNPQGVGLGLSGKIFTLLYRPAESAITCRTMVNSFITLLVEQGIVTTLALWSFMCFGAVGSLQIIINRTVGVKRKIFAVGCFISIGSAILSGTASTCFDLSIITKSAGNLNDSLLLLLWVVFCAVIICAMILILNTIPPRTAALLSGLSIILATLPITVLYGIGKSSEKKYSCHIVKRNNICWADVIKTSDAPVMYSLPDSTVIQEDFLVNFIQTRFPTCNFSFPVSDFSVSQGKFPAEAKIIILSGKFSSLAKHIEDKPIIFLLPSPINQQLPANTDKIYLSKYDQWGNNQFWLNLAATNNLPPDTVKYIP